MNKRTKALQFDQATKKIIVERDQDCIFCKLEFPAPYDGNIFDIAHVVNKSQGGLGIEQNGIKACRYHHHLMDNGSMPQLRQMAMDYLKEIYPEWDKRNLIYKKEY